MIDDGKEQCDVEAALAVLLREDVLFANAMRYWAPEWEADQDNPGRLKDSGRGELAGPTIVLFVNCNDVFAWGCADAEPLPYNEVGNLYRAWAFGPWGVAKWCCLRRKIRPQERVEALMRQAGVWDDAMEALPPAA